jgi:hypothetical protein
MKSNMQTNTSLPDDGPLEHKHLGPVESIEPLDQSCPICETKILRIFHRNTANELRTYIACDCAAEEDFFGESVLLSPKGFHQSIRVIWGEEVLDLMRTYPHLFPPGSIPGAVDLS